MKIVLSKDVNHVENIKRALKDNDGYCPCRFIKDDDSKCICKEFREQTTTGLCHCGLYEKVED